MNKFLLAATVALMMIEPAAAQSCRELRRACEMKDQLGEQGQGNCRAYREQCGGGRQVDCRALRQACMFKNELGEQGQGNCRTYRQQCGGRT